MLEVRLLGKYEARLKDRSIDLSSRPAQSLLAYLLLNPNQPIRREKLAGLIWPDSTEANARGSLRHALWQVRKSFDSEADAYLHADDLTISLRLHPDDWVDVNLLEAQIQDDISTGALIEIASAYGAELLPGFYEDWVAAERERLKTVFEQKMDVLLDRLVGESRLEEVIWWGERWISLGFTPEHAYRAIMIAHAGLGDLGKAAAVYQRCVQALERDLGVKPSRQTREIYQKLVDGHLSFQKTQPGVSPRMELRARHNLPPSISPFIGRETDLEKVANLLQDPTCRLVTLVGPGGIGKTRLAAQAAEDILPAFQHGAWFVPLESLDAASFLAEAIAAAPGIPLSEGAKPAEQLLEFLRHKELLLILDNFEHLLPSGTGLLIEILQAAPGVQLLVTSREILNLQAECLYEVRGLGFPEDGQAVTLDAYPAAALFLQLAERAAATADQDEDNNHVARIAWLVEGSPLAIELAAAWTRVLSCREIAEEIERGLDLLQTNMPELAERHRSMRAVFNQSWSLLPREEKTVLRQLSVFRGGFDREAANQVAGASLDTLRGLVDKSLISRHPSGRYRIHTLLRQFAGRELEQAGEVEATRERHLAYFLLFAQQAEPELWRDKEKIWLDRLEAEHDNLRGAIEWSLSSQSALGVRAGLSMSLALEMFWWNHSHYREAVGWLDYLLAHPKAAEYPTAFAHGLRSVATLNYRVFGKFEVARAQFERSMVIAKQHGDSLVLAHVLSDFGNFCTIIEQNLPQAQTYLERSLVLFRELEYQPGIITVLRRLGHHSKANGDPLAALSYYEESVRICRSLQNSSGIAWGLYELGWLSARAGYFSEARDYLEESLVLYRNLDAKFIETQVRAELSRLEFATGEITQAAGYLEEMLAACRKFGTKMDMPEILTILGDISRYQDEFAKALSYYDEALALAQGMGYKKIQISALLAKSFVFLRQGDGLHTLPLIEQGLWLSREMNFPYRSAIAMIGLAGLSVARGKVQRAARLWGISEELLQSTYIAINYNPADYADYKRIKGQIQQQLDDATFNQLVQEGRAMAAEGLDRVIAYAFDES